jgi:hypothetical protein
MADHIDLLKAQFDEAHAEDNKHRTNIRRDKLTVSMQLAEAHALMDMARATVLYTDAALAVDSNHVKAHLLKARALEGMGNKRGAARKAADAGLIACDNVACLEGLSNFKAEFRAMQERLPPPKEKAPKAAKLATGTSAQTKNSVVPPAPTTDSRPSSSSSSSPPLPVPPPSAALRPKSAWNTKDTWEEVDVTDWAIDSFASHLEGTTCALPEVKTTTNVAGSGGQQVVVRGTVTLTALKNAGGHAQVVYFQRKRRTLYELDFDVHWEADLVVVVVASEEATSSSSAAESEAAPREMAGGEKRVRFKGFVSLGELVQDMDDPSDVVLVSVPFKEKGGSGSGEAAATTTTADPARDPARTAVKRWIESSAAGGGSAGIMASTERAPLSFPSLRSAVLSSARGFEKDFKALGESTQESSSSANSLGGTSGGSGRGSASSTSTKATTPVQAHRSVRRRNEAAEAVIRDSELAASRQAAAENAARASAVEDLKQSNPGLKVAI